MWPFPDGGRDLLRAGRFDEAQDAFHSRLPAGSSRRVALAQLGLGYLALLRNDLTEAEGRAGAALAARPGDARARELLAEVHYRQDDFARAAPLYRLTGREAVARKLESFAGREPYRIESGGSPGTQVPFIRTDPLPFVRAAVNGREGRFLIDTGGGELILDRRFAARVGAVAFGDERHDFAGGKSAGFDHGRIESLEIRGVRAGRAAGPVHGRQRHRPGAG